MLAFIKNKIAERMPDVVNHTENDIPDSVVVECAHLIQELDALTIEGQDAIDARNGVSDRPLANALDIPLEDDIEIGSLELNVLDGRLTDIPSDTSVPTVNEYALNTALKTEEDFYKEACEHVKPFFRDSEAAIEERRQEYVQKKMAEYREYLVQEGLFGFGKIDINDPQVPVNTMINFGPVKGEGSKDYIVKLPVYFQVDKNRKITKKQLESLTVINSIDGFYQLRSHIYESYSGHSNFKLKEEDIWDHATPKEALVPVDPPDKYCVMVVVDTDWDGEQIYSCRVRMKGLGKEKKAEIKKAVNIQNKKSVYKNAKDVIKEYAELMEEEKMRSFPSRFVQEEVDLGTDGDVTDNPPASNADSDVTIDVNGDEGTASVDTSDNPPSSDAPADPSTGDTTEIPVETNDVSDQIADKVASETQDMSSDEAINDDLNDVSDSDVSDLDTSMDGADGADLPGDDTSTINPEDFDNMSIDDLINQGSEKLKSMSIGQLKQFLSGDENLDPMVEEAFQEAFFLTPRNINKEIYKELKRVLGILNDSQEPSDAILKKFKKYSRRLNRALVKAAKMEKVYSDQERQAFKKANKCLLDLNVIIGSEKDANYGATVKRLILAFVSESRRVEQIVVDHDPSLNEGKEEKKGMSQLKIKESYFTDDDSDIITEGDQSQTQSQQKTNNTGLSQVEIKAKIDEFKNHLLQMKKAVEALGKDRFDQVCDKLWDVIKYAHNTKKYDVRKVYTQACSWSPSCGTQYYFVLMPRDWYKRSEDDIKQLPGNCIILTIQAVKNNGKADIDVCRYNIGKTDDYINMVHGKQLDVVQSPQTAGFE